MHVLQHTNEAAEAPADPAAATERGSETCAERAILCATCATPITSSEHRIAVSGSHDHRFMNPGGFTFHIGCFSAAIGCAIIGPDSLEYPWFAGFSWRYAMCGACGVHLGWHFRKADHAGFFGLVLDRLQQNAPGA